MGSSDEMEGLLKRIYHPMVFYLPYELFPDLSVKAKKDLEACGFLGDLGILKSDGGISSINQQVNGLELYRKDVVLEANLFQLLEMKEGLKSRSFGFLFEKYLSNVNAWIYAYNWLLLNLVKQIPQATESNIAMFEYQKVAMENHLASLEQYFGLKPQRDTGKNEIANILLDNKGTLPLGNELVDDIVGSTKDMGRVKKQEKKPLMTDKQVDDYLLKTVFNLKID